jgi:hypothetical protein
MHHCKAHFLLLTAPSGDDVICMAARGGFPAMKHATWQYAPLGPMAQMEATDVLRS